MKPNFALTLSFDGIGLLHRIGTMWRSVGEVALDADDLSGALAALREKALTLDPSGIRSKVAIPNDQIKYISFPRNGATGNVLLETVREHLTGATPYPLDQLAFDHSFAKGTCFVAAVALETLQEAESFAIEHDFNPLCFVAIPEQGNFVGEVSFGLTDHAIQTLAEDEEVERDRHRIRIIDDETAAALDADAAKGAAKASDAPDDGLPEPSKDKPDPEVAGNNDPISGPKDESAPALDTDAAKGAANASDAPDGSAPKPTAAKPDFEVSGNDNADSGPKIDIADEPDKAPRPVNDRQEAQATASSADAPAPPETKTDRAKAPVDTNSEPEEDTSATAAPAVTFASIRASRRDSAPGQSPKLAGAARINAPEPAEIAKPVPAAAPETTPNAAPSVPRPEPDPHLLVNPQVSASATPSADMTPVESGFVSRRVKAPAAPQPIAAPAPAPAPKPRTIDDEKRQMTVFGARGPAAVDQPRGKPRHLALMMTGVLLVFLAGVATWASLFLDDGMSQLFGGSDQTRVTEIVQPDDSPDMTLQPQVTPQAEAPITGTTESEKTADETVLAALPDDAEVQLDAPQMLTPAEPAELSPDAARARYAATGIWQMAPAPPSTPEMTSLDDFYQTSIDPAVVTQDAIALPTPEADRNDRRLATPGSPPAAGTRFALDNRGLVRATPGGALTPDGLQVFAGRPNAAPGDVPVRAVLGSGIADVAEIKRLGSVRPRLRPGDLSEQNERSNLSGRTRVELATLRPRLRPQSAQQAAEAQLRAEARAAAAASTVDPDALQQALQEAVQTPEPFSSATAQAVRTSLKPNTRPGNFDRIVSQTRSSQPQVAVSAAQRIAPRIPTAASVTRQATQKNVLNLRRVNLIGVYGTPGSRRALVRLSNGRYKKVQVGDRLDGGRVQAIGDSQLRYDKRGRNVVLKMPKG